ncbi:hypothetical protein CPA50_15575 [Marinobacter sp. ANT_B65]|nr:hypothetical protein CPA50_15575 [Marinobacter sp. ANT_B65]
MRLGWFKGDQLVSIVNWVGTPLVIFYVYGMTIHPLFNGAGGWSNLHKVWMDWQTLNVGVLAFISSLIAFNISKHHANQQREREFIAAKSFLPEALSELVAYFKSSAIVLNEAWWKAKDDSSRKKGPLQSDTPQLPENYKEIFSRCISLAPPDVSVYLSYILMRLQVHNARITGLFEDFQPNSTMSVLPVNVISYIYSLGELQALANKIFDYARGIDDFRDEALNWEDFRNAYRSLNISIGQVDDLEPSTKLAVGRGSTHGWKT